MMSNEEENVVDNPEDRPQRISNDLDGEEAMQKVMNRTFNGGFRETSTSRFRNTQSKIRNTKNQRKSESKNNSAEAEGDKQKKQKNIFDDTPAI